MFSRRSDHAREDVRESSHGTHVGQAPRTGVPNSCLISGTFPCVDAAMAHAQGGLRSCHAKPEELAFRIAGETAHSSDAARKSPLWWPVSGICFHAPKECDAQRGKFVVAPCWEPRSTGGGKQKTDTPETGST